jgi:hypothetical protein
VVAAPTCRRDVDGSGTRSALLYGPCIPMRCNRGIDGGLEALWAAQVDPGSLCSFECRGRVVK